MTAVESNTLLGLTASVDIDQENDVYSIASQGKAHHYGNNREGTVPHTLTRTTSTITNIHNVGWLLVRAAAQWQSTDRVSQWPWV